MGCDLAGLGEGSGMTDSAALFDLERIHERHDRRGWRMQCEVCGAWVRRLWAVRDAGGAVVWKCAGCVRRQS